MPTGPRVVVRALDVYEAILAEGASPARAEEVRAMRRVFEERAGAFGPDDPWFEARSRAFWDDAVAGQAFGAVVAPTLPEPQRPWALAFSRAHRGLFRVRREASGFVLEDRWSGVSFLLGSTLESDLEPGLRDALDAASQLFDGRVAGLTDPLRIVLLPGALFHPAEATEPIEAVLGAARAAALPTGAVLDGLLRMERQFAGLSRMKASFAYRPEALSPRHSVT